jgi:hypothetical protein
LDAEANMGPRGKHPRKGKRVDRTEKEVPGPGGALRVLFSIERGASDTDGDDEKDEE